ncbi:glycoside hydrolase superfamily [Armillaria borealis]|uniref:Glycoside hydrolase superfamily n=1 Tax=Armillaria borealis TaxID=47425 RepID=A0AA39JFA6_9AGAR|nr:glycoside hydrolase superfamily [Armillaria borealis]
MRAELSFLLAVLVISKDFSAAFAALTTGASTGITSASATSTSNSAASTVVTTPTSFPPVGSIPRDYSSEGLEKLWDMVGPVEPPPFTTTRVPTASVTLPPSPPPLYPSFYAPAPKDILPGLKFPNGFLFGVDTAAYQVEGATKNDGKGPTTWDWASRQPNAIADNTTGKISTSDVVDLQYFLYKEDIMRSAALGVKAHSFSISWARIFPFGTADSPLNPVGIAHYSDGTSFKYLELIDYHLAHGIEPVVTLFHWDVPLALQSFYGGFTSPNIVDDYVNYAKTIFKAFNGRVKTWYTFNEPRVFCGQLGSYPFNETVAPGVNASTAPYQCSYNLLKAHAAAVKAFREMGISGEIALKNDDYIGTPWRSNSTEDPLAVERHAAFQIGVFSDPIYTTGDWPTILTDTLSPEYLPRFTEDEKKDILGSADFYAIDCYRSQFIRAPPEGIDACVANTSHPLWPVCNDPVFYDSDYGWAEGPSADPLSSWLQATPVNVRGELQELHKRWPTNKLYVSEIGFAEPFESEWTDMFRIMEDVTRTNYFLTYLGEILLSIHEDGVPIQGTFAWAMIDNAEWADGLTARFGIQYVNYTTLERTFKRSALSLSEFFGSHLQN